ncbi:7358_t:CDS:2 [Cetraspora pellucida]|uniref:7358_t:CDS:1 n=1 Tax=Cetraspora pellucida TaxID=1433469 RepID=A0A9N8WM52_9GLOM|nr:7358_t:CDS:2 [Cetraspora pellucida]
MQKRKRTYTPEQQLAYRRNESEKRQACCKHQLVTNNKNKVLSACQLTDDDYNFLKKFCDTVTELKYNYCPICKECFLSITLNYKTGNCNKCSRDKLIPKRFSLENDMDSEEVPSELPHLSQVEEMLISQVLPMLTIFNLRGGQLEYRGHLFDELDKIVLHSKTLKSNIQIY